MNKFIAQLLAASILYLGTCFPQVPKSLPPPPPPLNSIGNRKSNGVIPNRNAWMKPDFGRAPRGRRGRNSTKNVLPLPKEKLLTSKQETDATVCKIEITSVKKNPPMEATKAVPWNVSDDQHAIICGTLLGDGHIQKRGNSYRLKIAHCAKQKSYTDWMHNKLESLCKTTQGVTKREYKNEIVYEFYTESNLYLKKYHDLFYQQEEKLVNGTKKIEYRKTITPKLIASLPKNNYTLACFYLDDGSPREDCYSGRIAIQGFSKNEGHLLEGYFRDTWNVATNVTLHSRAKDQYSLSIPAKAFPKFVDIVNKSIHEVPDMVYKLNEKNRNKSLSFKKKE